MQEPVPEEFLWLSLQFLRRSRKKKRLVGAGYYMSVPKLPLQTVIYLPKYPWLSLLFSPLCYSSPHGQKGNRKVDAFTSLLIKFQTTCR